MSARGGIILFNSSFIGVGSSVVQSWIGGRSVVSVCAAAYPPNGVQLLFQALGPQANWVPICSSFVADQLFSFDAAPGQYALSFTGSTAVGFCASLNAVSHS